MSSRGSRASCSPADVPSGQGQERVLDRRPVDPEIERDDPVRNQLGRDERQHRAGATDLDGLSRAAPWTRPRRASSNQPRSGSDVVNRTTDGSPSPSISPCGVSSATTFPLSTTATRSQRCSASSMKCVTSTTVVPPSSDLSDQLPRRSSSLGIEPLRQLVEEDQLGRVDERQRDEQPLALTAGKPRAGGSARTCAPGPVGPGQNSKPRPARMCCVPLALDGTDGVPAGSVIVIKGLPPGSALSNGARPGRDGVELEAGRDRRSASRRGRRGQRRVAADHPARGAE